MLALRCLPAAHGWAHAQEDNAQTRGNNMAWMTPTLIEICIGLEINGYLPAEF
jgi:coenzyme PQQ precursor peptide PqqA